jgi:putative peptide zinc metalloprotease protein
VWTILMVWPIVFSVSAYHEFSHGLTCSHYGGQVKEMGFILIYFSPAFYCDVSDAWMFPKRRHRMFVTLAGGYSQLMFWGLCTIVWRITEPDTFINHTMVVVVVFSGLQTLLNFNPLIKLDGYYMLSDYLEVPNLRAKAFSTLWNWITRNPKRKAFHEERAQLLYGVCAVLFSSTLLVAAYAAIYTWSTNNWATAGLVGFAVFSTLTLRRTAVESMSGLKAFVSHVSVKKFRNASIVVVAVLLSIFVHWELKITADFKILPQHDFEVRAETAGLVNEVKVHEGQRVRKGDLLATTRDFDKQNQLPRIRGELVEKQITLERLINGPLPEEISQQNARIDTKQEQIDNTRRNQEERKRREDVLSQRKAELTYLQQKAEASRQLLVRGYIAKIEADAAQTAVEVKQKEIDEAETSIRVLAEDAEREANFRGKELLGLNTDLALLKKGNRPELIRATLADVDKLKALLASMNEEIAKSEIRAPIDGTVATPFPERLRNKKLAAGETFIRLVDTSGLVAEMLVPEKYVAEIKTGDVVWMRTRSLSNEDFQGRVDTIAVVAQTENAQQMVKVRARLSNENDSLRPETTGVARIYVGQRRIIDIMTWRIRTWIRTEFLPLLP